MTSDKRHPLAPEIPTVAESYPGFEALNWVGIVAPAGVRREIVTRLNTELLKTVHPPDVGESPANRGYDVVGSTPEVFAGWMRAETERWGRVVRERNITLE